MAHVCIKCEKEFETEHKLEEHVQEHTIEDEVLNVNKESGFRRASPQSQPEAQRNITKIKCEKCANIFQLKSLLDVHKLTHSKYECKGKNCGISFKNKKAV